MLQLRPICENCACELPPDSTEARICSFECTFCRACVDGVLGNVCPNCGGGFQSRPVRPSREWRPGVSLATCPAVTERKHKPVDPDTHRDFAAPIVGVAPKPVDASPFQCPLTFMGLPFGHDLSRARVAVAGIPFDVGTDASRVGARHGPQAIRIQSRRVGGHFPPYEDVDVPRALGAVDCGDVRVIPSYLEEAQAAIESAIGGILDAGAIPVTMGGDGTVTLPQLRAAARRHPGLVVLHIDAHTDAVYGEGRAFATGTTFMRAAEEGLLDVAASMHLGVRGPHKGAGVYTQCDALGYPMVNFAALRARGIPDVLDEVRERMAGRPVYACFDMDFFDPAYAPGVCAPTPGGATSEEGLAIVDALEVLDVVAVDVNTVSPPHDPAGITAMLAARVMLGFMRNIWRRGLR